MLIFLIYFISDYEIATIEAAENILNENLGYVAEGNLDEEVEPEVEPEVEAEEVEEVEEVVE